MVPIETKEMRGLTPKTVFSIAAGAIVVIVSAVVMWYTQVTQISQDKARIDVLEINAEATKLKIQENEIWKVRIEGMIDRNKEKIDNNSNNKK